MPGYKPTDMQEAADFLHCSAVHSCCTQTLVCVHELTGNLRIPNSICWANSHSTSYCEYIFLHSLTMQPVQDYDKIRRQCLNNNILFEDPYFPADDTSLFSDKKLSFSPKWLRPKVSRYTDRSRYLAIRDLASYKRVLEATIATLVSP